MQKISGFFTNHGIWSVDNIPLVVAETEKTFTTDCDFNIVIKENVGFSQSRAKKIFERSIDEEDLLRLYLESDLRGEKIEIFRKLYTLENKALFLGKARDYINFLLDKLSELRKRVPFQLLFESGTTDQIDIIGKQQKYAIQEEFGAFMRGEKERVERLTIEGEILLYKQSRLRDELLKSKIDELLKQYSDLRLQIIFGKQHRLLLDPYFNQTGIEVSIVVHDELGDSISDTIFTKIKDGENFSMWDRQMSVMADCITWLVETLCNMPEVINRGIILHRGKVIEAALACFSVKYYNELACNKGVPSIKVLNFLERTGAFSVLTEEYPEAIDFCRFLAKKARDL